MSSLLSILPKECQLWLSTLPKYSALMTQANTRAPLPFCEEWYGTKYRHCAADLDWLALSLVQNAEKEAEGSGKLWALSARTPSAPIAEQVRRHAIDESRHADVYIRLCDRVFPRAIGSEIRPLVETLSPRYRVTQHPAPSEHSTMAGVLDELVQMNIGEIRTCANQLLMRPVLLSITDKARAIGVGAALDALLSDELRHIGYTALLIEEHCATEPDFFEHIVALRLRDFHDLTLDEVDKSCYVSE
jgi:hypothetical protein